MTGTPNACRRPVAPLLQDAVAIFALQFDSSGNVEVVGPGRLDVTYRMHVATPTGIPVTIPFVGDCLLHVDTTPGVAPTLRHDVSLLLSVDRFNTIGISNGVVSDLTSDDVTQSGNLGCQFAHMGLNFYTGLLSEVLAQQFQVSASAASAIPESPNVARDPGR